MKKTNSKTNTYYTFTPRISSILRKLLYQNRIRAIELAATLGMPNQTIYQLLNKDVIYPKISTLLPIAKFFKVTVGQLIGDEPLVLSKSIADKATRAISSYNQESADMVRYELDMMTYILGRIIYHAAQNTTCPPSLTWALTYKLKQLIQLLLERKECCWLDLLQNVKCQIPGQISQILVQFKIHSIDEIPNLQGLPFIDLTKLFGLLHDNLLIYENERSVTVTKQYPIAFLPMLNKEVEAFTERWRDEYLTLEFCEPRIGEQKNDADVINLTQKIVASTRGAIECCRLCLEEWDKHEDISHDWKEELSELRTNYSKLKGLVQIFLDSAALSDQLKAGLNLKSNNKGASHV